MIHVALVLLQLPFQVDLFAQKKKKKKKGLGFTITLICRTEQCSVVQAIKEENSVH